MEVNLRHSNIHSSKLWEVNLLKSADISEEVAVLVASLLSDPEDGDLFLQNVTYLVLFFRVAAVRTANSVH
jgi:hypothetical protein